MTAAKRVGWIALGVVAIAGIGLTAAAANGFGFAPPTETGEQAPPATAEITKQDLVATTEEAGEVANAEERTLKGQGGVVTWLPAAGAVLERGATVYRVDETPTVLLSGSLPAYRALDVGTIGADVQQFEENLAALGYTGFDVDTEYTAATAEAVEAWQKALGVEQTGVVEPSRVHVAAGPVEVVDVAAEVGDEASGNLLTVASRDRIITVDLDETDAGYAVVGAAVTVTLPDGTAFPAKVTAVETVVTPGQEKPDGSTGDDTTVLHVTLAPDDPAALAATGSSTAKVGFTADHREGVLAVPVSALLALAEGGYGVEVVDGDTTRLVAVETGLFAGGLVEVSGEGIAAGDRVVIPE